ncbi:MAG: hypothetical protein AAFV72_05690 [Cyanobacteria bacterium J06635_1]
MLVVLEAKKFHRDCVKRPGTSRMIYQGTSIRRGPSFAISLLQQAEEFCWHYLSGSRCFLVKDDTLCTVWIQTAEIIHAQPSEKTIAVKQMAPTSEQGGLELSYRGRKYIKKRPDAAANSTAQFAVSEAPGSSQPAALRKYRGISY